jgi:hypothetical protein
MKNAATPHAGIHMDNLRSRAIWSRTGIWTWYFQNASPGMINIFKATSCNAYVEKILL